MKSEKNYLTALVLCFIGGTGGLHYFYVGRWRRGLIYLFTCGLCGIGFFADIIKLFRYEFTDKYGFTLMP